MDFDSPDFMNSLREALKKVLDGDPRGRGPGARRVEPRAAQDDFKVNELPEFNGSADPEMYLEWERKIERMFDFKDLDDEKRCKYAILKLGKSASLWYEGVKAQRARDRKEKITSWESLKRKLRKRYVPSNHRLNLYKKVSDLVQGKLSVLEYIDEFETLCLMAKLEENEEQKMSRFLRGLNKNIQFAVELCNYSDFDTLCTLCLKVENQNKSRYNVGSASNWNKGGTSTQTIPLPTLKTAPTRPVETVPKQSLNVPKETSLTKVRCFKCQGFGHFSRACPNQRVVTLREAIEVRDMLYEEENTLDGVFNLEEPDLEGNVEKDFEEYEPPKFDTLVLITLQTKTMPLEVDQSNQLFHTKCQVKDTW